MKLVYCDFIAGYFGGACGIIFGHPFDTIKTWQQVHKTKVTTTMYNIIIRNNGLNGFYKGFYFPLITNGTIHALVYGIYGNVMRCDTDEQRQNLLKRHMLIAGCSTGLAQAVLGCPIEVVKIRLQTLGYIGRSYDCMKYIYNHEGVYGLYRGLVPMIWRDILPYGIYMLVNDWMFEMCNKIAVVRAIRMQSETGNSELAIKLEGLFTSLAALLASVVSWSLITPLDVVKTTMQAETNPNIHRNMLECVLMLWRAHNYRVLFSGIFMNIGKSFAILWGYQYCLSKCQACAVKRNEDRLYK